MVVKLKDGERISVDIIRDGKERRFHIEANPQFKSVTIYDEHFRKMTLHAGLGNKSAETKVARKINEGMKRHTKKNGVKIRR